MSQPKVVCAFLLVVFSVVGSLAQSRQQNVTPLDDNSNTPLQRQRAQVREQEKALERSRGRDLAIEKDDPTARLDWQRHTSGVFSPEAKSRFLRQRAARRTTGGAGSASIDLSSARFAAVPPQANSSSTDPVWVPVGPADADYEQNGDASGLVRDSGRARTILPHPTDPNTLYFLTSGGGLWVTNNFLSDPPTWTPLTDNLPTTGGGAVRFGRTPNVLYLGLGDPFDVINVGGAVAKSIDGGQTWTVVDLGNPQSVRDIQVDTSTGQDIVLVATDIGLFRSQD
ncbi:MAG TPA: hypothetical protein VE734_12225, partial [Terriglobales bacterium]|nr:hypothetical protein [Terriglobales bacterium]